MSEGAGLFREKSLERLSSPERLDQLLRVVDRRSWVPLLTLCVLVAIVVAWSVFGRIPVYVQGRGMIGRPREIVAIDTPSDGYVIEMSFHVGDRVAPGTVIGRVRKPETEKELTLERQKAEELAAQIRAVRVTAGDAAGAAGDCPLDANSDSVSSYIAEYRRLAESLRTREQKVVDDERKRLQEQWDLAHDLAETRRKRLDAQRKLQEQGVVAIESLVEVEAALVDSLSRMSDVEGKLRELTTRELEIQDRYLDRIDRISDREQQFADVNRKIAMLDIQLKEGGQIVAPCGGRVIELNVAMGEYLEAGNRIGSISNSPDEAGSPLETVTYFTVKDGKRIAPGMRILVTPDVVERERFGSIEGTVTSVSPFPVSLGEAEKVVGNRDIAEALVTGGYRIQVFAQLASDPSTKSTFRWSASKGPDFAITAGTTTTSRAIVERRAPVTFVIPILKSAAGLD